MTNYIELLSLVQYSLVAAAVLGVVGGIVGVFVMQRDMAFAVHGVSELSFAGAAGALLLGVSVVAGSLAGSLAAALAIAAATWGVVPGSGMHHACYREHSSIRRWPSRG